MMRRSWPIALAGLTVVAFLTGCTAEYGGSYSQGGQTGSAPAKPPSSPVTAPADHGGATPPAAPAPATKPAPQPSTKPQPTPKPAPAPPAPQPAPTGSVGKGGDGGAAAPSSAAPATDPAKLAIDQRLAVSGGEFILTAVKDGQRWAGFRPTGAVALWSKETIPSDGAATVRLEKGLALVQSEKMGAPEYAAYQLTAGGLTPVNWYERIAPAPTVTTGPFLLVNKHLNALWYFQDGKLKKAYRVTTGRQTAPPYPDAQNYRTNYFTPEGEYKVTNYVRNPAYYTLNKTERNYAGGEAGNPLGTRWMGFGVFSGDGANIWGIHGTSHPDLMGTWNSDGCIRMYTSQVEELFGLLGGRPATLKVVSGR